MTNSNEIPVLAIDGPSGSGKGTIARQVAAALGWHLLDSGALYRLVGLDAARKGVALDDDGALAALARDLDVRFASDPEGDEQIVLDGEDVTTAVRSEDAGTAASAATHSRWRDALVRVKAKVR